MIKCACVVHNKPKIDIVQPYLFFQFFNPGAHYAILFCQNEAKFSVSKTRGNYDEVCMRGS